MRRLLLSLLLFAPFLSVHAQNCTVNANIDETICANQQMRLQGNSSGLVASGPVWSQVGGPSVTITTPTSLNTTVTGFTPGNTYTFRLTATCQDNNIVFDEVDFTVDPITISDAGPDQASCPGTLTMAANAVGANETGTWVLGSNPGGISIVTPNSPTSDITLPTTSAGVSELIWRISHSNGCTDRDTVFITNYGGESPVSAGSDQTLSNCYTAFQSTSLSGTFGGNGLGGQQGTWTMVTGPNYPTIANPNNNSTNISGLIEGTYTFRWDVSGPCVTGTDEVDIIVPAATQDVSAASGTDVVHCNPATSAVLVGTVPQFAGETVQWVQTAGPGGVTITNPNNPTTSVTGLDGASTYTFSYTITNSATACDDTDGGVTIRYYTGAPSISAGPDQVLACDDTTAAIPVTVSGGSTSRYRVITGPSTTGWINFSGSTADVTLSQPGTHTILFERFADGIECDNAYDYVTVTTSRTASAANAGTDQNLACGVVATALAGNAPAAGLGIGTWTQVSGPNSATIASPNDPNSGISGLIAGQYVFRWNIANGVGCPTEQDEVVINVADGAPTAAAAGPDLSVCPGAAVVLQGNMPLGSETGTWTVAPAAGVTFSNANDPAATVTGLSASTAYTFTWTIANACGSSSDDAVYTTGATGGPTDADAGPDQCLPGGTTTASMAGNTAVSGTGTWTVLSGPNSPSITAPNSETTTITGMVDGVYEIEWAIALGGCQTTTDTVIIAISSVSSADAGPDQDVCGNSATMAAVAPATGTGTWVQVIGNAGWTVSNINDPAAVFSNLTDGVYAFLWEVDNGPCGIVDDSVFLRVGTPPTAAAAGTDQTICGATSATMAATPATVGIGTWTLTGSGTNSPTITDPNSPTTTITGLATGTYSFIWTTMNGPFCPSSSDQVDLQVSAPADAGPDQDLCESTETLLVGTDGTSGSWAQVAGPAGPTITPNSAYTAIVSNMTLANTYTFEYTAPSIFGCPATTDQVDVSTDPFGTTPNAGPDQEICTSSGNSITMSGNAPGGGEVGTWTLVTGPNSPAITNANDPATTVTGLVEGLYIFEWNISNGLCPIHKDVVRITVFDPPTPANAGPDQNTACQLTATLAGNLPTTGIGVWTLTAGPGAATIDNPNLPNSTISNVTVPGTYTFTWTITNGVVCSPSADAVDITFPANPPTTPDAGMDQDLCNAAMTTMTGNIIAVGTGTWTQASGPAGAAITAPNNEATTITGLTVGTYEFVWESANGGCTLTDTVEIENSFDAGSANAGGDQTVCPFAGVTLNATDPTPALGTWTLISGPSTPVFADPNDPNTVVNGTVPGVYVFEWTVTAGACPAYTDQVTVTVDGNCPPTTFNENETTMEDVPLNRNAAAGILGNGDFDGEGHNLAVTTTPLSGPSNGGIALNTDGSYVYTPSQDFNGLDTVVVNVCDDGTPVLCTPDTLFITVTAVNDAPVANTDRDTFPFGTTGPVILDPQDNDTDVENDPLTTTMILSGPSSGGSATIVNNDSISYTPPGGFSGTDTIVYQICDPEPLCDTDTIFVFIESIDSDGDGLSDVNDLDSDNDGILDVDEDGSTGFDPTGDLDNDGTPNVFDPDLPGYVDSDGNGYDDRFDKDRDSLPDYLDLDSDNDGIVDALEADGTDADGDGIIGIAPFTDTDMDGWSDVTDPTNGGTPLAVPNTDGDALRDFVDIDADDDGIHDNIEAQLTAAHVLPSGNDTDMDGLDDAYDTDNGGFAVVPVNTDTDAISDWRDGDADGDGLVDLNEGWDTDGDDIPDTTPSGNDSDNDGLDDNFDVDGASTVDAGGPSNGGRVPSFFPDDDNPGNDRDWRELRDTDGDGVADINDLDSDNDGIPDTTETGLTGVDPTADDDMDGVPNFADPDQTGFVDANNDGIDDRYDTDGDGIPDYLDLDSDNDGIADVTEAGGSDPDRDGIIGTGPITDTDNDGWSDIADPDNGGTPLPVPNTDGDTRANYVDLDSDNDGITDVTEAGGTDANGDGIIDGYADTDRDGLSDNVDPTVGGSPLPITNSDSDALPDYIDLDSDNDGITDVREAGGPDANGDGEIDGFTDGNMNGLSESVDPAAAGTPLPITNSDSDANRDYLDLDSDNDGITDVREAGGTDANGDGEIDSFSDGNMNGLSENVDPNATGTPLPITNSDSDPNPDYLDLDSDNDGITDVTEAGGTDADGDGEIDSFSDGNLNGLSENVDPNATGTPLPITNSDSDPLPDYIDLDSENDGLTDVAEAGGTDANGDGEIDGFSDGNLNGLSENVDPNAAGTPLPLTNSDSDPNPDHLDLDSDNDGITDVTEAGGTDTNGDGEIDSFSDGNNNGLSENVDPNATGTPLPVTNTDSDANPDHLDLDSDNDGITDAREAGDADANGDGEIDGFSDPNLNGLSDNVDPAASGTPLPITNSDSDPNPNYLDLDADNDGITDVTEAGGTDANGDGEIDGFSDGNLNGLSENVDPNAAGTPLPVPNSDSDALEDYVDLDSDNDALTDAYEAGGTDANGDGEIDGFSDANLNGLSENVDPNATGTPLPITNSDSDTNPDHLDLDADNDGITDTREAGGNDANGDGEIDGFSDANLNGLSENVDPNATGTPLAIENTDSDPNPNHLDLDSDNDGITDAREAGGADADGDGEIDGFSDGNLNGLSENVDPNAAGTPLPVTNSDADPLENYIDLDSDNDGITDVTEAGGTDANGDGEIDAFSDGNLNGLSENVDPNATGTPLPVTNSDADPLENYIDLDSDNDGITDVTEAGGTDINGDGEIDAFSDGNNNGLSENVDPNATGTPLTITNTDADPLADYIDLDSDNDGITDTREAGDTDTNGDGEIDAFSDGNNNGLSDNVDPAATGTPLPVTNSDADPLANYIDLDSDNDGITDVTEAGGTDANGDGEIDAFSDGNNNGLSENVDPNATGTPLPVTNTDSDPLENYVDLDSDNDGITDVTEAGGTDTNGDGEIDAFSDGNNNGLSENVDPNAAGTPLPITNSDGDALPNYIDLDSENDGITDTWEAGGADANGDGEIDAFSDPNNNGLSENVDPNAAGTPLLIPNTDSDPLADYIDLDADNDGITDVTEAGGTDADGDGEIDAFSDPNNNGLSENVDPNATGTPLPIPNTDGDTKVDHLDLDAENDGITDATEAGGTDANGDGEIDGFSDGNNNGLSENVDPNATGTPLPIDNTDGDTKPNYVDLDSDNDGITDDTEAGGTDANGDGVIDGFADANDNGLSDNVDPAATGTPLPVTNSDGALLPNYIDLDSDNDGIVDVIEAGENDANNDGIIDGFTDVNDNGLSDNVDPGNGGTPLVPLPDKDGDSYPTYIDIDADDDGIVDAIEGGGTDPDGDGYIGSAPFTDTDNDGWSNVTDPDNGGTPLAIPDTDTDTWPDYLDIDADDDGIVDNIEGQSTAGYIAPIGMDTDTDGLDNAYDTDNGGTAVVPVDTDSDLAPDWLELETDNDGFPDALEGWDTDGDGVANTVPAGADSDNDGLDNAYDVDGISTTDAGGPTNGGTLPTNFPDDDNPGGDRDWREPLDTDGDGIADINDLDSDNDGILDTEEDGDVAVDPSGDDDNDGTPNYLDPDQTGYVDANGDRVDDRYDFDMDGHADFIDPDSDNDGIVDALEADGTDADGDGVIGTAPFTDTDGDGWSDVTDPDNGGTPLATPDTDGDTHRDFLDIDADDDGIVDNIEGQSTVGYLAPAGTDTDRDGLDDSYDPDQGGATVVPVDTDTDTEADWRDLETDNDGWEDLVEGWDTDGDGIPNTTPSGNDSDNDGLDDAFDVDGTALVDAGGPTNGGTVPTDFPDDDNPGDDMDWREPLDSDGDGIADIFDLDSDNDGILDTEETSSLVDDPSADADNDGTPNYIDSSTPGFVDADMNGVDDRYDTDGDGFPDFLDHDSDNDGLADVVEAGGEDPDGDGVIGTGPISDPNGDGWSAIADPNDGGTPLPVPNTDGTAGRDFVDIDADDDGITDVIEARGDDADQDGVVGSGPISDADGDGMSDIVDTDDGGTVLLNPNTDGNGGRDYIDIDADDDGIVDVIEGQSTAGYIAALGNDSDGDGLDDAWDIDNGGTYVVPVNIDGDANPDWVDLDTDDDQKPDATEGWDTDGDQTPNVTPSGSDSDNDGLDDAYDVDGGNATNAGGADNGGTVPTDFPDWQNGPDRDWRWNNTPPVAVDDNVIADPDSLNTINVLGNDSDLDGNTLTVTDIPCAPSNGVAFISGNEITYLPNPGYTGPDTLCYVICDGNGGCDTAFVYITVDNPAPVAVDDEVTASGTNPVTIVSLMNDNDPNDDSLTVTSLPCMPSNGIALITGNTVRYIANEGFFGADSLCYVICDDGTPSRCDTAWIRIWVEPSALEIPNMFTPNGDGDNETFTIRGLTELFPDNELQVFNRWGNIVYEREDYANDWDGTFFKNGQPVPEGTYYYVLDTKDGERPRSGFIVIMR